jgi:subtilisin family serine protease
MKSKNLFLVVLIAGILGCAILLPFTANNRAPQAKSFYAPASDNYAPGEVLLKFREGTSQIAANKANSSVQAVLMGNPGPSKIYHVKLPSNTSVEEAIEEYMKDPNVEFAEPNYIRSTQAIAAEYAQLWAISNTGQTVDGVAGLPDADMDVLQFWTNSGVNASSTMIIAVIDTGVLLTHQDLAANIWTNTLEIANSIDDDGNGKADDINGWDFVNNDANPTDDNGHGTHVSGIIAADGTNGVGITGVMQRAQIMALKVCDSTGLICNTSDIIDAIDYATSRKRDKGENVRIINLSLGGLGFSQSEYTSISQARAAGILVVAAAGNSSADNDYPLTASYPASYDLDNIISVAAIDQNDALASFSNYGFVSVDVAAPGVNVTSTYYSSTSSYAFLDGTSMAAPNVSGVAGLLWAVNGGWTYTQVRNAIINNVDHKLCLSGIIASGGRVNAEQARNSPIVDLATPTGLTATSASSTAINVSWTDTASEEGYNIYRKLCAGACSSYSLIYTVTSTSKLDTGLNPGTCYSYHVRAYTTSTSERSDESTESVAATAISQSISQGQSSQGQDSGHSRNCFIATAAYGSSMHPYVESLREFRDKHLLTNYLGRKFVDTYYKYSPPVAEVIKNSEFLKAVTRIVLTPVVIFVVYPYTSLAVFIILSMITVSLINRKQKARI